MKKAFPMLLYTLVVAGQIKRGLPRQVSCASTLASLNYAPVLCYILH